MLVETKNLVAVEEFRSNLDDYVAAARQGDGPFAVMGNGKVVGFFVATDEYEALYEAAMAKLLARRLKDETVPHDEARARIRDVIRKAARKK